MYPQATIPERLFVDDAAEARWRARYTASRLSRPSWAEDNPDRNIYISNASGTWETYVWDRHTDTHRQVTNRPTGTVEATLSRDGEYVWWFSDEEGSEFGRWVREPFSGRAEGEKPQVAAPGVPDAYSAGIVVGNKATVLGYSTDEGTTIWVMKTGEQPSLVYQHEASGGVCSLSRDEQYFLIAHSEHGDLRRTALRVLRVADGTTVADKWDGAEKGLEGLAFSPVSGDQRVLVLHERRGKEELLLWDVVNDTETELLIDLPGDIVADWYPDGNSLLVFHTYQARNTLYKYDISTQKLSLLDTAKGTISSAEVRPDGIVEYSWSSAEHPPVIRAIKPDGTDQVLLEPAGITAPMSEPAQDIFIDGPGGQIHVFFARPAHAPEGPLPTVFDLHGGPHAASDDHFSPYRAAWLDAGFAVVQVNYRGSTGYGSAWRDAIEGRPGFTELEDVAAVHDWAIASGLTDPAKCIVEGGSWGGYLVLLALGTQPERWSAGIASVPIADCISAFEEETGQIRDMDRSLFGGSPLEKPELYRISSPITYADQVKVPVLIEAAENDSRCPIKQIENYLDRLIELKSDFTLYRYDSGHASLVIEESMRQTALEISFAKEKLGLSS